jgi:hypothetical protein
MAASESSGSRLEDRLRFYSTKYRAGNETYESLAQSLRDAQAEHDRRRTSGDEVFPPLQRGEVSYEIVSVGGDDRSAVVLLLRVARHIDNASQAVLRTDRWYELTHVVREDGEWREISSRGVDADEMGMSKPQEVRHIFSDAIGGIKLTEGQHRTGHDFTWPEDWRE